MSEEINLTSKADNAASDTDGDTSAATSTKILEDDCTNSVNKKYPFLVGTDYSDCYFTDKTEEVSWLHIACFLFILYYVFPWPSCILQEANMFMDTSEEHPYEVRGKTYMTDKQKLSTGSSIFRFVVADIIRVGKWVTSCIRVWVYCIVCDDSN